MDFAKNLQAVAAKELDIENLPLEEQREIITLFGDIATRAVASAVLEALPEEKREPFMKVADTDNKEAIAGFLNRELPNHEAITAATIKDEIRRFKEFKKSSTES